MAVRIVTAGAVPSQDPSLVIAAVAARQAATPTARLAARIDARGRHGHAADGDAGGSFHVAVARAESSTFVKPGFTVAF